MKTVCEKSSCTACRACVDACNQNAITVKDEGKVFSPIVDEVKCINCGACTRVCQNLNKVAGKEPEKWFQGWAEKGVREVASSGGFATAMAGAFIEQGGIVCSCRFSEGDFTFTFAEQIEQLKYFVGSKYVKSNAQGAYKQVRELLIAGKSVLFIALPCQVAALNLFIKDSLKSNLYTVDVICHGTPSLSNLSFFLSQYGYFLEEIEDLCFRRKNKFRLKQAQFICNQGTFDRYTLAFLNSINYTEKCYACQFAKTERIADVTLGDSWGSNLDEEEKKKGISLALSMTNKGEFLLQAAKLHLEDVDIASAVRSNQQLVRPCPKPKMRDVFFTELEKGKSFNSAAMRAIPRTCLNQMIKTMILKATGRKKSLDYEICISPKKEIKDHV